MPLAKPSNKHRGRPEIRPHTDDDDIGGGGCGGCGGCRDGLVAGAGVDDEACGGGGAELCIALKGCGQSGRGICMCSDGASRVPRY